MRKINLYSRQLFDVHFKDLFTFRQRLKENLKDIFKICQSTKTYKHILKIDSVKYYCRYEFTCFYNRTFIRANSFLF